MRGAAPAPEHTLVHTLLSRGEEGGKAVLPDEALLGCPGRLQPAGPPAKSEYHKAARTAPSGVGPVRGKLSPWSLRPSVRANKKEMTYAEPLSA